MTKEQKNTLIACMTTAFITTFMGSSLNLAVPNIEAHFGVGASVVGWVVTAYMLAVSSLNVPLGKVADQTGRRRMFILAIAIFGCASIIGAFSVSIWMLLGMRLLQGMAGAMIFATNNALLMSAFPPSERGSVLGKSTAATYIGLSAGPVIGGLLNGYLGWRSIFIATGMISAIAFLIAVKGLPKRDEGMAHGRFDMKGSMLYFAMIIMILYGLTDLSIMRSARYILAAGLALSVVFVIAEKRSEDPIIRVDMFTKDRPFLCSNLAAFLNYGATFTVGYLLSMYLQLIMGFSSQKAGLILILQPAIQALFSPYMGRLSDRIAPHKLASAGMGICAAGLILLSRLNEDSPMAYVLVILVVMGFGFAVFSSPNVNAIMSRVDPKDFGVANSIVATMRNMGQSTSMAVVTIVMGILVGNAALASVPAARLMHAIHVIFAIFVVICAIGVFLSLARGKEG
ncbi:MAG: MFS transporter [Firmicutes bacterium]|nr:MFS transporter [Bacillota bacterium]